MITKIEIGVRSEFLDAHSDQTLKDIRDLGLSQVEHVTANKIYYLDGDISDAVIARITKTLLTDPITEYFAINQPLREAAVSEWVVEITYNPGVMDPVEGSTLKGISDLGIDSINKIKTAVRYYIKGKLT
ncbi:phosphoribosylformylglycinamidine synthase subunit PurS, partial [bacterium]|nr:phosphoribosylformylglycinamidine synthase subunit PurS [bacterium]